MCWITRERGVLAEAALHVDRQQRVLCLLGGADGHLVEPPRLPRLDKIGVKPRGQTGDLGYGSRQADARLAFGSSGHVARKGEMGRDRLREAAGRCPLL